MSTIRVQAEAFDTGAEIARLTEGRPDIGGIGCFVGVVRASEADPIAALTLEHYPAMTAPALARIAAEATARWHLLGCTLIHRVGRLRPGRADRAGPRRRRPPRAGARGDRVPDRLAQDEGAVLEEGDACRRSRDLG